MIVDTWPRFPFKNMPPEAQGMYRRALALAPAHVQEAVRRRKEGTAVSETAVEPAKDKPRPAKAAKPKIAHQLRSHLKVFKGPDAEDRAYASWMDLRARIGRHINSPDLVAERFMDRSGYDLRSILATATEGNPGGGGYLVPSPIGNEVIELRARVGLARRLSFVQPMKSDSAAVPRVEADSHPTVYYVNEVAAITPSDITFGQIFLHAKKRALLSYVSRELFDDAQVSFLDLLTRRMAYGLAKNEDREFVLGDGTSAFGNAVGIAGAIGAAGIHTAAAGHDTLLELDLTDFVSTQALLPEWAADGREAWIMSSAAYAAAALRAMGGNAQGFDANGNPLLLGKPVLFSPNMPATSAASTIVAFYGNFEEAVVFGDRISFAMTMSEHAAFENDVVAFRGVSRYDISVDGGDAATPGAYVGLKTAA